MPLSTQILDETEEHAAKNCHEGCYEDRHTSHKGTEFVHFLDKKSAQRDEQNKQNSEKKLQIVWGHQLPWFEERCQSYVQG